MVETSEQNLSFGFDTDAEEITNSLWLCVRMELENGVKSLPMLDRPDHLLEQMQKPFAKNIDVFEIYCQRNIFSIDMYGRSRRREIIALLQNDAPTMDINMESEDLAEVDQDQSTNPDLDGDMTQLESLRNPSELPSAQELSELEEQALKLRQLLSMLEDQRSALLCDVKELKISEGVLQGNLTSESELYQRASATAIGREGVEDLHLRSAELLDRINQTQACYPHDNDGMVGVEKELGIKEIFERERRVLSGSSVNDLSLLVQRISNAKRGKVAYG